MSEQDSKAQDNTDGADGKDAQNDKGGRANGDESNTGMENKGGEADSRKADGGGKGQEDKGGKEGEKKAESAKSPDEYTDFNLPENFNPVDSELSEFKSLAKKLDLTQEQAQEAVNLFTKLRGVDSTAIQEAIQKERDSWVEAVKADKEIGGAEMNEKLALAKKALDTFGTPELAKVLDESGFGNHPELARWAYRVGKAISEDKLVTGDNNQKKEFTLKSFYDKSNHA